MNIMAIAVSALLLTTATAQAGVVTYRWEELTPLTWVRSDGTRVLRSSGWSIDIDYEVWRTGSLSVHTGSWGNDYAALYSSGLADLSIVSRSFSRVSCTMAEDFGQQGGACETSPDWLVYAGQLDMELQFNGNHLSGSISLSSVYTDIRLGGDSVWSVSSLGSEELVSDYPYSCGREGDSPCTATGRWVLDRSTVQGLPEPSTAALLSLALLGLVLSAPGRFRRIQS